MATIYETKNFTLESHERPEVDRLEGGHIKISAKRDIVDRAELTPEEAIELMRLTIVAGKAMVKGMAKGGVEIGRINYQDNGNWNPHFHIHLYGRAIDAKIQKYGDPIISGHQDSFNKLSNKDTDAIRAEIDLLFNSEEFSDKTWRLS
ncbi:MAG: HIT domain-containing protein [Candidatus Moraniibacteriota bacterium]